MDKPWERPQDVFPTIDGVVNGIVEFRHFTSHSVRPLPASTVPAENLHHALVMLPCRLLIGLNAFVEMVRDPIYREAVKHRQAAVRDSRLIRTAPMLVGKIFGEIPN